MHPMKKLSMSLPALLLLGVAAGTASGQQPSTQQPSAQQPRAAAADTARTAAQTPTAPLLDAPVSRTEYQLGPGDVLDVAVFGDVSFLRTLELTLVDARATPVGAQS